jgi:signal transduction histidine kinase
MTHHPSIKLVLAIICVLLQSFSVYAGLEVGAANEGPISLTRFAETLEDPSGRLTIHDVAEPDRAKSFRQDYKAGLALDFEHSGSAWWIKLPLRNDDSQPVKRLLQITNSHLSHISFFSPNPNGMYEEIRTGNQVPFESRPHLTHDFVFSVTLPPKSECSYFFRIESPTRKLVPIRIWTVERFAAYERNYYGIQGVYFGIVLTILSMASFMYWAVRETIYITYMGLVASLSLSIFSMNGISKEFVPLDSSWWSLYSASLFFMLVMFFLLKFAREFLKISTQLPTLDKVFKALMVIFLVVIPIIQVMTEHQYYSLIYAFSFAVISLILGVNLYFVYLRQRNSYFFLAAFLCPFLMFAVNSLAATGWIPQIVDFPLSTQLASAVEMIILAFAVTDQAQQMRLEKEQAQRSVIDLQENLVQTLQISEKHLAELVERRVVELRRLIDMLSHEIKTPMSVIRLFFGIENAPQKFKNDALNAIQDIDDIIERCVSTNKVEHGKLNITRQQCSLHELLDVLADTHPEVARIQVELLSASDVYTDPKILKLIVSNLLENALKYSPDSSVVRVTVAEAQKEAISGLSIKFLNQAGLAGLPDIARVFEKYYRSPGAHSLSGSGLGLYLVKTFAEMLGGTIRYHAEGNQVVFDLWIPR